MNALRLLLLLRGAFGVLFALTMLLSPASAQLTQMLGRDGLFALVDGLLALAVALALRSSPRWQWLFGLALVDALVRLLVGIVALAYPDLGARILGSVAFYGGVITACIALGVTGLLAALAGRRAVPPRAGTGLLQLLSLCTLLLGVGLLVELASGGSQWLLVPYFALAVGLCLLGAGLRLQRAAAA